MAKIELIIFDCDGVLIDSELISCECSLAALRAAGMPIDLQTVVHRFLGTSRREMAMQVAQAGYAVPPDFVERLETSVARAFEQRLTAIAGVREAIGKLNMARCVASNSPVPYVRRALELAGLLGLFGDSLFSASMVERGKPAPDLFLYAAEQMGVPPERSLVIEDSLVGVRAANDAGMRVFRFLGGSHAELEGRSTPSQIVAADAVFYHMNDLFDLIGSLTHEP